MADPQVRADVVAGLALPDGRDFAEYALNATPAERHVAAHLAGHLYSTSALQAVALDTVREILHDWWDVPARRRWPLGQVLKIVPAEVKARVVTVLDTAGWNVSDL